MAPGSLYRAIPTRSGPGVCGVIPQAKRRCLRHHGIIKHGSAQSCECIGHGEDLMGDEIWCARLFLNSIGSSHQNEFSEHAKTMRKLKTWRVRWDADPMVTISTMPFGSNNQAQSALPWNSRPLVLSKAPNTRILLDVLHTPTALGTSHRTIRDACC